MLKFTATGGVIYVHHENGVFCGEIISGDDGYYNWWPPYPPTRGGCWPNAFLKEIVSYIDNLNLPWETDTEAYFHDHPS
jgi:hypothetical protein